MNARAGLFALGIGLTVFAIVAAIVTEMATAVIAFSAFVGLPAGILAGVLAAGWAYLELTSRRPAIGERTAGAIAAFGYALVFLFVVQYAVAAVRDLLDVYVIVGIGILAAIGTWLLVGRGRGTADPFQG